MHQNDITKGMMLQIKIPASGFFDWMATTATNNAYASWMDYVKQSEHMLVTVDRGPIPGKEDWPNFPALHPHYFVSLVERPAWVFAVEWLQLPVTNNKIACNCSMAMLMTTGCTNKDHS